MVKPQFTICQGREVNFSNGLFGCFERQTGPCSKGLSAGMQEWSTAEGELWEDGAVIPGEAARVPGLHLNPQGPVQLDSCMRTQGIPKIHPNIIPKGSI